MKIGKKLYQSSAMPSIKVMAIAVALTLFLNLYFQTYNDPSFLEKGEKGLVAVLRYHLNYPQELIVYLLAVLYPAIYYGFFRGVRFYENGLAINRGLPFFNMFIPYDKIKKYEVITQNHFLAISRSDTEDEYMFTVNKIDRAVAILDQHDIPGELGKEAVIDRNAHKKLALIFIGVGVAIALIQYSGVIRDLLR